MGPLALLMLKMWADSSMYLVRNHSGTAFTRLELLCRVAAIIVLAATLIGGLGRVRERGRRIQCTDNLKQLGIASTSWALENEGSFLSQPNDRLKLLAADGLVFNYFLDFSNRLSTPKILFCPAESNPARSPAGDFTSLTNDNQVSYFVGLGGNESAPQMFPYGDHYLSINGVAATQGIHVLRTNDVVAWTRDGHHGQGNVLLWDGSAQQYSSSSLNRGLTAGWATNSLAFP